MKYNIVGFPKCGTQSLERYLAEQGHDVVRTELVYFDDGIKQHEDNYSDYTPVFITREPIDRMWSLYWFNWYHEDMSFDEFKILRTDLGKNFGVNTPESCSDYPKYIREWEHLNPLVVRLEHMKTLEGFPHLNKNANYPEVTQ